MADYGFYRTAYRGSSIPEGEFPRLSRRAGEQLERYRRVYRVTAPEKDSEDLALCAMADALYYFETAANGGLTTGSSIGSVSSSAQAPAVDVSPRAQARELYRCAALYLDIYRGCGRC